MAIIDLTGYTWVGNELLTFPFEQDEFYINFICSNSETGNEISIRTKFDGSVMYKFPDGAGGYAYEYVYRYEDDSGWLNDAYKTIQITGGADATNSTLIQWLQDNGTLTAPQPTILQNSFNSFGLNNNILLFNNKQYNLVSESTDISVAESSYNDIKVEDNNDNTITITINGQSIVVNKYSQ